MIEAAKALAKEWDKLGESGEFIAKAILLFIMIFICSIVVPVVVTIGSDLIARVCGKNSNKFRAIIAFVFSMCAAAMVCGMAVFVAYSSRFAVHADSLGRCASTIAIIGLAGGGVCLMMVKEIWNGTW